MKCKCMPLFSPRAQTGTQQKLSWAAFWGVFFSVFIYFGHIFWAIHTCESVHLLLNLLCTKGLVCCSAILCDQKKTQKLSFSKKAKFPALITCTHWLTDTIRGDKFHLNWSQIQLHFQRKITMEARGHQTSFSLWYRRIQPDCKTVQV